MAKFQIPQPAAEPAKSVAPAPTPGFRPPMVEGVYVPNLRHMPPEDRARLESLGWKPGQAIPTNLPELLAEDVPPEVQQLQAAYAAQDPTPAAPATPVTFHTVPLTSLPQAQQADINRSIELAASVFQQPQAQPAQVQQPQVQPARVAAALAAAQQMHAAQQAQPTYEGLNPQLAATLRNTQKLPVVDDLAESRPATQAPEPAPAADTTGLETKRTKCARCGFPCDKDDIVEITETDKLRWLQTLGSEQQFTRDFHYYGARGVTVTLRTLSTADHDAIVAQIFRDISEKRIEPTDRVEYYERYMATLMLQKLAAYEREPLEFPSTLAAYARSQPESPDLVRTIYTAIYINGPLQVLTTARLVGQAVRDMISLTHKLEAAAYDPDF